MEDIGLANTRDLPKMLRWNDKYGIKFMRLSSEMFPFASHAEYGYKLAPFASEALAEVGKVATELGHRLSTHPGQFTQLGSPRAEVINNAIRDLEYHDELLTLLKLPPQSDRDAVMILHLGGTFGDKAATLDRFRENYKNLSPSVKQRIVLENDDVSWSIHDLLPLCEELNIPLCLDFHHHNIIFDSTKVREGTQDVIPIFPRIKATWERKQIRQKMHYSEPTPEAVTECQRRKHNPRKSTLPPCPNDMDLMIEAKDKEQAVFELMRTFKLPGFEKIHDIIPYERADDNKPFPKNLKKKKTKKQIASEIEEFGKELSEEEDAAKALIPEFEVGMGGKENRVYWPVGMEEWLRPKKRETKKKAGDDEEQMFKNPTPANFAARKAISARNKEPLGDEMKTKLHEAANLADVQRFLDEIKAQRVAGTEAMEDEDGRSVAKKRKATPKKAATPKKPTAKVVPTPSISNLEDEEDDDDLSMPDLSASDDDDAVDRKIREAAITAVPARQSVRAKQTKSYVEADADVEDE